MQFQKYHDGNGMVAHILKSGLHTWKIRLPLRPSTNIQEHIDNLSSLLAAATLNLEDDKVVLWKMDGTKSFSTAFLYLLLNIRGINLIQVCFRNLEASCTSKTQMFCWTMLEEKAKYQGFNWGKLNKNLGGSILCHHVHETIDLLFTKCNLLSSIWSVICSNLGVPYQGSSLESLGISWKFRNFPKNVQPGTLMLFATMSWWRWKERNAQIFLHNFSYANLLLQQQLQLKLFETTMTGRLSAPPSFCQPSPKPGTELKIFLQHSNLRSLEPS